MPSTETTTTPAPREPLPYTELGLLSLTPEEREEEDRLIHLADRYRPAREVTLCDLYVCV